MRFLLGHFLTTEICGRYPKGCHLHVGDLYNGEQNGEITVQLLSVGLGQRSAL